MRGIYKITSKINEKVYIGESLDILKRWDEHIKELKNNEHHSYKLQNDWNKYGEDNFEFNIISVLDNSIKGFIDKYICLIYESKYIEKYNSIDEGYNIEYSLKKVLDKDKSVTKNTEKDSALLKTWIENVKQNHIVEKGGIIYSNLYDMEDLNEQLELNDSYKLKSILFNNGFIVESKNTYILNEDKFKHGGIVTNKSFTSMKILRNVFCELYDFCKKLLDEGYNDFYIVKNKNDDDFIKTNFTSNENKEIKIDKNTKKRNIKLCDMPIFNSDGFDNINDRCKTMKDFADELKLLVSYNDMFKFLRDNNVFEYVNQNDSKKNMPTNDFRKYFSLKYYESSDGITRTTLYITENGMNFFKKYFIENNIIIE